MYDSRIERFFSRDPKEKIYSWQSTYAYYKNSPISIIDYLGMGDNDDEYLFKKDGTFKEKIEKPGEDYIRVEGSDKKIKFADPVNDPKAIDNKIITNLVFTTKEAINNELRKSGAFDQKNKEKNIEFLLDESNATNINGTGKMDFVTHDFDLLTSNDPKKSTHIPISSSSTLFITNTICGGLVAHNNNNFGNFLWGASTRALFIPFGMAQIGAHVHNAFMDPNNSGFDSSDDQFSIYLGYKMQCENKPLWERVLLGSGSR